MSTINLEELQKEYAETCAEEKRVLARKARVKKELEELYPQEDYSEDTEYGIFKMVAYPTWHYTDAVNNLEEDLKILKIEEQERYVATKEVKFGLRFNPKKDG